MKAAVLFTCCALYILLNKRLSITALAQESVLKSLILITGVSGRGANSQSIIFRNENQ